MKRIIFFALLINISFCVSAQYSNTKDHLRSFSPIDFKIRLLDKEGNRMQESRNKPFEYNQKLNPGETISFVGSKYMTLQVGDEGQKSIVYSPRNSGSIVIPPVREKEKGPKIYRQEQIKVSINEVTSEDLLKYRNLAFNPYDWQTDNVSFFPHIETNSECRNEYRYSARNVINGLSENTSHGKWKDRSWGPEQITDPWIDIDFGRLVEVDKVVIYIRADFPHDGYWRTANLAFDDGTEEIIKFKKTAKPQTFTFSKRKIKSFRIKELTQPKPLQWCALTEVQVWGKEAFPFELKDSWSKTLKSINWHPDMQENDELYWSTLSQKFPIETDWLMQETSGDFIEFSKSAKELNSWKNLIEAIISELSDPLQNDFKKKLNSKRNDLIDLYVDAHKAKRKAFLSLLEEKGKEYIFVKRYRFTPSFFAYTEGLSDARNEHTFTPGAELCKASIENGKIKITTLLNDEDGMIRDPDVSYDGKRILFAWKKSYDQDDYHLYEYNTEDESIKQLTFGLGQADFEGKYLPDGNIIFNSTRCEQTVDCWKTDVSNLYLMKNDGRFLRRVGFDQVQTTYPTVMENGKIIYTRWDYNDRGQTFPQPLFSMNPDGTAQTEFYGNNSWYPTTITHARQIPGTNKVMATFCGHHTWQHGKIGIVDPSKGRQENVGIQLIAPIREEEPVRIDQYGQKGIQFQYPYPFNEDHFLVTSDPINGKVHTPFSLYFMNSDGEREMLAWDKKLDCKQAVPLAPREKVFVKPTRVDYTKDKGYYYVQNVYHGAGADGIKKGSIKKLRVVSIEFRAAPIRGNHGDNNEGGVNVGNLSSTPIGLGQGAWDVKKVIGEVTVEKDGSAMFEVPARTPVYFQLIDSAGYVAQTMRSWSTLQPGETFSCVGCHEDKNESVPMANKSLAMAKGVQQLQSFHNIKEGFSFRKHVQPILNKNCISCHNNRDSKRLNNGENSISDLLTSSSENKKGGDKAFSLLDEPVNGYAAGREWNDAYLNLLGASYNTDQDPRSRTFKGSFKSELVNWPGMQSVPTLLTPYYRGAATSKLMKILKKGHGKTSLTKQELEIISCWIDLQVPYCGDYKEANIWSEEEMKYYDYYLNKREKSDKEDADNIQKLLEYISPN
jgi:hypothetical protein